MGNEALWYVATFIALTSVWIAVNVGIVMLVGWLGVLLMNVVCAAQYPLYMGFASAAALRFIAHILRPRA